MKRCLYAFLLLGAFLFSACGNGAEGSSSVSSSQETVLSDTRPVEIREVDQMLQKLTDFHYELSSEEQIHFAGRWFEKEIDGVTHHVTVNAGSELYQGKTDRVMTKRRIPDRLFVRADA